jgi:predicted metal-dependent phosphoesterase TrpH
VRIDLHTHSTVSDGTDSPAALVELAAAAGLDVVGLTDHDSTLGWDEAAASAQRMGIALVRGVELSARMAGRSVHILSYLHDRSDPGLNAESAQVRDSRVTRAERMVQRLAADYPIDWQAVVAQTAPGTTIGRPHIADALVAAGVSPNRSAAFASLLAPGGPYYVRHYATPAAQMVRLIRNAGGVPVLAHPGAKSRGNPVDDDDIVHMCEAGLAGLEVRHRDNPPEERARLERLAERLNLLVTGSSDYHGTGKPNRLGENLTDAPTLNAILAQGAAPLV